MGKTWSRLLGTFSDSYCGIGSMSRITKCNLFLEIDCHTKSVRFDLLGLGNWEKNQVNYYLLGLEINLLCNFENF